MGVDVCADHLVFTGNWLELRQCDTGPLQVMSVLWREMPIGCGER